MKTWWLTCCTCFNKVFLEQLHQCVDISSVFFIKKFLLVFAPSLSCTWALIGVHSLFCILDFEEINQLQSKMKLISLIRTAKALLSAGCCAIRLHVQMSIIWFVFVSVLIARAKWEFNCFATIFASRHTEALATSHTSPNTPQSLKWVCTVYMLETQ